MRLKFRIFLFSTALLGILFLLQGGSTSGYNPILGFLNRLENGDSPEETLQLQDWECVEEAFELFPQRSTFRIDVDDPFYHQRIIEIGFPQVYFDAVNADFSLAITSETSADGALLEFPCPTFGLVINNVP